MEQACTLEMQNRTTTLREPASTENCGYENFFYIDNLTDDLHRGRNNLFVSHKPLYDDRKVASKILLDAM